MNWKEVEEIVFHHSLYKDGVHGIDHIRRTVENAKIIAKETCPDKFDDAVIGAYLHDIGRIDDFGGNAHAVRGAKISERLLQEFWPNLDIKRILFAIEFHADKLTSEDPLIGTIWDADRLDLDRVGIKINPDLLSTKKAKEILQQRLKNSLNPADQ